MPAAPHVLDPLREGPTSGTGLLRTLQLPQPRLERALQTLQREGQVLQAGTQRRPHYALPRRIAGAGTRWPVYQVDAAGNVREFGRLTALMPRHFQFDPCAGVAGISDGLPWFLRSAALASLRHVPEAGEDARLYWLVEQGGDVPGDLIIGAAALDAWRRSTAQPTALPASERGVHYPRLAAAVDAAQSSFDVLLDHGGHAARATVKFSAPRDTAAGRSGADLLICEHLALGYLNSRGVAAAHSRVYRFEGRIYLEVDRFDRVGVAGRRGLVPIGAALGSHGVAFVSWSHAAAHLHSVGALPKNDARQVRLLEAFAVLIGRAQRGPDALVLFDRHDGTFALAPAFDLQPHVPALSGSAPGPAMPMVAGLEDVWPQARRLAEGYWERLAGEAQLTPSLRAACSRALAVLRGKS